MLALNRILAAVDFSTASEGALRRAFDLAARTGADLHVLHVAPGTDDEYAFVELSEADRAFYRRLWDRADEELATLIRRMPEGTVHTRRVLSHGVPSRVTLDYAEQEGVDLIVMGTHGRRGLRRFFLGSVAGEVLRRTGVPVLVVPEAAGEHHAPRSVLAPTDFSDASRWTLPIAASLAAMQGADLDIVHVFEPVRFVEVMVGVEAATTMLPDLRADAEQCLEQLVEDEGLAEALAEGSEEGVPVESGRARSRINCHLVEGRAAASIVEAAQEHSAGTIVMAKRGLHGVDRLLLGSVTERVCRLSPCSVLVVPISVSTTS